ncbi:hypothetical protein [Cytobacillus massiliigabonensis]|uniref:hypothetical protein n=1 Tax=Cytobacillus massiliigabonensis TaxID=1871011 RepID=UPI000C845260|nr:hypothetical protein [Cytobacillus massiliigabonensis]
MAKLSGVKTLDMTNGEVTKVEYNGEVYAKVGGKAQVGDLVLVNDAGDLGDYDKGDYFETVDDGRFRANNNGWRNANDAVFSYRYTILRKQSVQSDGFKLVTDREPKAGDFVKYTESPYSFIKVGKYYEITEIDGGDPCHYDEDGDSVFPSYVEKYEFYEKVAKPETLTHNGATYTLVDRKAQPGDVVVFTESHRDYAQNGKPYLVDDRNEITDEEGDRISVYNDGLSYNRTPANVKVYEPQVAPVAVEKPLCVGDYAKVVRNVLEYEEGNVVKIIGDKASGDVNSFDFKVEFVNVTGRSKYIDQTHGYIDSKEIVRATDEEVAKAKAELNRPKVGDYVRLLDGNGVARKGDIAKIVRDDGSGVPFEIEYLNGKYAGWKIADEVEKISAEEVEQHRAEQAELARWAAIGRKPNKYKKGDIAKLITTDGSIYFGEISSTEGSTVKFKHLHVIRYGTTTERTKNLTLITPVEQRFDLTEQSE